MFFLKYCRSQVRHKGRVQIMFLHLRSLLVDTEMIQEHNSGLRTGLNHKYICTCPQQARNMSLPIQTIAVIKSHV